MKKTSKGHLRPDGMTTKSNTMPDKSMQPKGGSVDNAATRPGTAPTPRSLGPRTA